MGQEQSPHDYNDRSNDLSDLDRTQPSPTRPPRQLDWRPPDYQSGETTPEEKPPVRRVQRPARRRRPPTEGAPAWVVGLGVGALLAVIVLLALAFVVSRPTPPPKASPTTDVRTPTITMAPRTTFTPPPQETATSASGAAEETPAATLPLPDEIGVGGHVRVVAPAGLKFRRSPGTAGELIQLLNVDTVLEVIGGPQQADELTWWQLRKLDDGQEGWSADSAGEDVLLEPAPAP